MTTKATLRPGQKGTKRFAAKYGDRLVCVRYKYDEATGKRFTTVELIEEEADWRTKPPAAAKTEPITSSQRLPVRIDYWESELREKVKSAGAIWRPRHKLWEMRYEDIVALGLESRVVAEDELPSEV
jgi:hypothetical protein